MAHLVRDKKKLVDRIRRIAGQLQAVERSLDDDDCGATLQLIAACRGATDALMAEVIEGHVREHVIDPSRKPTSGQTQAAEQLIEIVRKYLR